MNGVPDSPLDEYAPVEQALVAHNTFIDCKVSLEFGVGAGKKLSVAPQNCRVIGNLLAPDKWQIFRTHSTPVGFVWADNRLSDTRKPRDPPVPFKQIPLTFERDACGLLRPTAPDHIEIAGDSIVSQDIDAHKRNGQNFCGCNDPTTVRRTPDLATNTGPRWRTVKGDTLEN